jgi:hypothetical protein
MCPLIQLKKATPLFLLALALVCFAFLPQMQAAPNALPAPPPDGCYPGFTTAEGCNALSLLTTGAGNTGLGWYSLFSAGAANYNTGVGAGTLALNNGDSNTAVGAAALLLNTTGTQNTAVGTDALVHNDSGSNNNAVGAFALFSNTTGPFNNAFGNGALFGNTTGDRNTAMGEGALLASTTGFQNTAVGVSALRNNTTGHANIAIGQDACNINGSASFNTGVGWEALVNNTADGNTAIGAAALVNNATGNGNTASGDGALLNNTTGSGNTALGAFAGSGVTTASNVICIGAGVGGANVSTTTWVGNIYGTTTVSGTTLPVIVSDGGQLGTTPSSRRFKKDIKPMDKTSEAILALKPVAFHYKSDKTNTPQFGLIAEEVAKVNPDLVVRDKNGEIYSVRYDQVNAMLLNEFLKEHRKVEELQATVAQQRRDSEATAARQQKQIETLTVGLQKVSAQLEVSKSAPRTVLNNQ